MHKRTKALDIPKAVKDRVWERDGHCCIICGSPYAMPNAHYIPRSQGGLGIDKNVVTLCMACHGLYDNSAHRKSFGVEIREYLQTKYAGWNTSDLYYRKV